MRRVKDITPDEMDGLGHKVLNEIIMGGMIHCDTCKRADQATVLVWNGNAREQLGEALRRALTILEQMG